MIRVLGTMLWVAGFAIFYGWVLLNIAAMAVP